MSRPARRRARVRGAVRSGPDLDSPGTRLPELPPAPRARSRANLRQLARVGIRGGVDGAPPPRHRSPHRALPAGGVSSAAALRRRRAAGVFVGRRPEMSLWGYVGWRLVQSAVLVLVVVSLCFAIIQMAPGDPVLYLYGAQSVSAETLDEIRRQWGLDRPAWGQYRAYVRHVARRDH